MVLQTLLLTSLFIGNSNALLDVAVFIMHHIKKLEIFFVSNQVKADLARSIANFTKTQCSEKHLVYVESITLMLLVQKPCREIGAN
jgi:hypothetical protein